MRRTKTMNIHYYHICANGADVRDFIISRKDYYAAFNLIAVCAANTKVTILSFSLEDSHPHIFLSGSPEDVAQFKTLFEQLYSKYVSATRGGGTGFVFHCELYPVTDNQYLTRVATYTIIQPTKDGKPVLFFDYPWGTGSLYFRRANRTPIWYYDEAGNIHTPKRFGDLSARERRSIIHTRRFTIPNDWLVCNGFILPSNYVDVKAFEAIYQTHNRYRVFIASPARIEDELKALMAEQRGITMEDMEARRICGDLCKQMFFTRDTRKLSATERVRLAQALRRQHRLTYRQIATLVHLPETEIRAYAH